MTFIEMQGVFLVLFFLNEIQVSFRVPVLLSFPFARNFKHHCSSVSSRHVKVWNRSAVFTMLQRASTLSDISCLFLLIKVSFPLQNQDAGAKKDKQAKNIQDALSCSQFDFSQQTVQRDWYFLYRGAQAPGLVKNNLMITQHHKKDFFPLMPR